LVRRGLIELGLDLDPTQWAAIDDHVRLLVAWNRAMNLTAIVEPDMVATRHVVDSLSGVDVLRRRGISRVLDIGSGGGFPGLALAIAVPLRHLCLVESTGRKAAFLTVAAAAVMARIPGLRVEVAAQRAEALARTPGWRETWEAVTVRAVGPLGELMELAFPLLERGGCLVAWKRGALEAELAGARRAATALGGATLEVMPVPVGALSDHRLVVATRTGAVPASYPRDPARRKRHPW
jgi:16S rRNA (guanine527-N7)-methyltransferase